MQQVDRAVAEMRQRFIKGRADQPGEAGVPALVKLVEFREDLFAVKAGVLVPSPGVDGVALGRRTQTLHSLTERQIGKPVMGSELDKNARPQGLRQPERKWRVLMPGRGDDIVGLPERGRREAMLNGRSAARRASAISRHVGVTRRRDLGRTPSSSVQLLKAQQLACDVLQLIARAGIAFRATGQPVNRADQRLPRVAPPYVIAGPLMLDHRGNRRFDIGRGRLVRQCEKTLQLLEICRAVDEPFIIVDRADFRLARMPEELNRVGKPTVFGEPGRYPVARLQHTRQLRRVAQTIDNSRREFQLFGDLVP